MENRYTNCVYDKETKIIYCFHNGYVIKVSPKADGSDGNEVSVSGMDSNLIPVENDVDVFGWLDETGPPISEGTGDDINKALNLMFDYVIDYIKDMNSIMKKYNQSNHLLADLSGSIITIKDGK